MTTREFTNDFKSDTSLDPAMAKKAQREVLKAAVQRAIFCPFSGRLLDVRNAVWVAPAVGPAAVITAELWDEKKDLIAEGCESHGVALEVYDGRELF